MWDESKFYLLSMISLETKVPVQSITIKKKSQIEFLNSLTLHPGSNTANQSSNMFGILGSTMHFSSDFPNFQISYELTDKKHALRNLHSYFLDIPHKIIFKQWTWSWESTAAARSILNFFLIEEWILIFLLESNNWY